MQTRSSYSLIRIGLAIRLLRNITGDDLKTFLLEHLEMLEGGLVKNGFTVSMVAIGIPKAIAESIENSDSETVTDKNALEFTEAIAHLEQTVYAEAETKSIYVLEQRRFTTEFLVEKPEKLLRNGEFDAISELARYDLSSACKCLLFGQATATAFHILRTTEEVLRQYYCHYKKRNRLKSPMWGPMVNELRNKRNPKPPMQVLNALDNIRESYRNPTQHPDKIYDIDTSQNLFGLCLDVISQMASKLKGT